MKKQFVHYVRKGMKYLIRNVTLKPNAVMVLNTLVKSVMMVIKSQEMAALIVKLILIINAKFKIKKAIVTHVKKTAKNAYLKIIKFSAQNAYLGSFYKTMLVCNVQKNVKNVKKPLIIV